MGEEHVIPAFSFPLQVNLPSTEAKPSLPSMGGDTLALCKSQMEPFFLLSLYLVPGQGPLLCRAKRSELRHREGLAEICREDLRPVFFFL